MCIYICVYTCVCVYIAFRQCLIYKRYTNKYIIWSYLFKLVIIFKFHFKLLSIWILWFLRQNVLFTNGCWCVCVCVCVVQSCLTHYDPMDCRLPGFSVHWILQARIVEWIAILLSRASSQPRDTTQVSCIVVTFFMVWATREAHGCWYMSSITLQDGAVWANWKLIL